MNLRLRLRVSARLLATRERWLKKLFSTSLSYSWMNSDLSYSLEKETSSSIFVSSYIFYSWMVARNLACDSPDVNIRSSLTSFPFFQRK